MANGVLPELLVSVLGRHYHNAFLVTRHRPSYSIDESCYLQENPLPLRQFSYVSCSKRIDSMYMYLGASSQKDKCLPELLWILLFFNEVRLVSRFCFITGKRDKLLHQTDIRYLPLSLPELEELLSSIAKDRLQPPTLLSFSVLLESTSAESVVLRFASHKMSLPFFTPIMKR